MPPAVNQIEVPASIDGLRHLTLQRHPIDVEKWGTSEIGFGDEVQ